MTTLIRENIDFDTINDDIKFSNDIQRALRYNTRINEIYKVFQKLNIVPFDNNSVEQYKNSVIAKDVLRNFCGGTYIMYSAATFLAACVLCLSYDFTPAGYFIGAFVIVSFLFKLFKLPFTLGVSKRWITECLYNYDEQIPEFVLQTAYDVLQECKAQYISDLSIWVEYLTESKDPFLFVVHKGHRYYLEVWNEPGFKQTRSI